MVEFSIDMRRRWVRPLVGCGALLASVGVWQAVAAAGWLDFPRVVFEEYFDDDALGATPASLADGEAPIINTAVGQVIGQKYSANGSVSVIRESTTLEDNCLQFVDFDPAVGGCRVECIPDYPVLDGPSRVRFTLQKSSSGTSEFKCSIIDNRATPGTGRLAGFSLKEGSKLFLGDTPTGFELLPGISYDVQIDLMLTYGTQDYWGFSIADTKSATRFAVSGMRCLADGGNISQFVMITDTEKDGTTPFTVDDIVIVSLDG